MKGVPNKVRHIIMVGTTINMEIETGTVQYVVFSSNTTVILGIAAYLTFFAQCNETRELYLIFCS